MKTEVAVFGLIILIVIVMTFVVNVPEIPNDVNLPDKGKAPELVGIHNWLNSEQLKIEDLKGKVVLVDFWTYSCINCIRTLPYLNAWHEKYSDKGLVVLGIHTPEFEFEKSAENVKAAIEKYGIKYAVAQDNDYETWKAYRNNYWPRKYLIDKEGNIRYDHIGEGSYDETEKAIQELLGEKGSISDVEAEKPGPVGTPELYFGHVFALPRGQNIGNPEGLKPNEAVDYKLPEEVLFNIVYVEGKWKSNSDNLESQGPGKIVLGYSAKSVNIVLGSEKPVEIEVILDDEPVKIPGKDLEDGKAQVQEERLYNIVSGEESNLHKLEILVKGAGLKAYAFTFG